MLVQIRYDARVEPVVNFVISGPNTISEPGSELSAIAVATLSDFELPLSARHAVDKPMLSGYPSRPPASKAVFQSLRFADAPERIAIDILDQRPDVLRYLGLGTLPILVIFPCPGGP